MNIRGISESVKFKHISGNRSMIISRMCCYVIVLLTLGGLTTAIPLGDFYPFGTTANDSSLPPNDDDFSAPIILNRPFPFFGSRHTTL